MRRLFLNGLHVVKLYTPVIDDELSSIAKIEVTKSHVSALQYAGGSTHLSLTRRPRDRALRLQAQETAAAIANPSTSLKPETDRRRGVRNDVCLPESIPSFRFVSPPNAPAGRKPRPGGRGQ
jgi:hypothetical protein